MRLGMVRRTDLVQQVTVAGTVLPRRRTMFTAAFNGYVKDLFVQVGQRLKAGAPVVTVVSSLRGEEEAHPMRAPFAGTVVQVLKTEGEFVETGSANGIVRIDDLSRLYLLSDVPEGDIDKIHLGQEAVVQVSGVANKTFHGIVREISLSAREKKEWNRSTEHVEFPVRLEIVDRDASLHPGMSAIVDIITDKRTKVLALRHEFVRKKDDHYLVTLSTGEKREVTVGMQNEEMFEIKGGLSEHDQVRMVDFISLARESDRAPATTN
jgi:multidrug efflux pump subunit AcrA (membrane-fusion protein)